MKLKNKTILITGASRGIGYQTAYEVAKEGANVIINYNNSIKQAQELEQLLKKDNHNNLMLLNIKKEIRYIKKNIIIKDNNLKEFIFSCKLL